MRNIVEEVNIGYNLINIKKIINAEAEVLDISATVYFNRWKNYYKQNKQNYDNKISKRNNRKNNVI